jgi:hypothetical protein
MTLAYTVIDFIIICNFVKSEPLNYVSDYNTVPGSNDLGRDNVLLYLLFRKMHFGFEKLRFIAFWFKKQRFKHIDRTT